jgi:hypothetical protein
VWLQDIVKILNKLQEVCRMKRMMTRKMWVELSLRILLTTIVMKRRATN